MKRLCELLFEKKTLFRIGSGNYGKGLRTVEDVSLLRHSTQYSGFHIDPEREKIVKREKPYGTMASRAIGGLDETFHGNSGLEKALDSLLYGIPGKTVKNRFRRVWSIGWPNLLGGDSM